MKVVVDAIRNTPEDYLEKTLQQRNPSPFSAGSVFVETQTEQSLIEADWIPLQHNADAVKAPAIAYQANISGFTGIADIDSLDESLPAIIQPAHAGKGIDKATGKLIAELVTVLPQSKMKTDFTTMIIGAMPDNPEKLQIWTFHPGAPVKPTDPIFMENIKETVTTIKEAKKLGFKIVKHIPSMAVFRCHPANLKIDKDTIMRSTISKLEINYSEWRKLPEEEQKFYIVVEQKHSSAIRQNIK